jgi:creatinine amidohydrolase
MGVHQLASISWPAFRELKSERLIAVLPLGAIEAHGPHLPLGTDIVIAEAMAGGGAARLAARGFEVLLLPALTVAAAPFAASFEGTIDIAPAATAATIEDIARSLARHGVRALVLANGHHDPAHVRALREAARQIDAERSAVIVFPDLTRRRWASRLTQEFQSGACHAGRYETSIVMAAAPDLVDTTVLPNLAPNERSLIVAMQQGKTTFETAGGPLAYFGAPGEASAAEGRDTIERLGAIVEDAVVEALGAQS